MNKSNDSKWKKYTYAKIAKTTDYTRISIMEWVFLKKKF